MFKEDNNGLHIGRRDFLKTTTMASMAASLPGTGILLQNAKKPPKPRSGGKKRKLVFLSDSTQAYESLIQSIKSIKEIEFLVSPIQVNYQKPQELTNSIQSATDAEILLMCLPRVNTSTGNIPALMGDLSVPVILLPPDPDLIMLEADLVAAFRVRGIHAMLANSPDQAIDLLRIVGFPGVLEGKRALIYGRPFDSTSVPARNLNEDYVYEHTGVRIQYRPIEELKAALESVDETRARKEMERWKKEAAAIVEPSDQAILDSCRLYVLLRSIVDREGLSAISIDCLSFSFSAKPILPLPCLAFTRLRDEGITAPCEADVCGLLSSMLLQEISQRPSYFFNVSSVDTQKSTSVLRHCVAPLRLMGREASPLAYNLRDYHGMGRGVTPEVSFPPGVEVTMGAFSKDLKDFILWPGRLQARVKDTDRPSFPNIPSSKMRMYCSNHTEVRIKNADLFLQKIAGCHHVLVAGGYANAIYNEMLRMNVNIIGPWDQSAPEIGKT